MRVLITETLQEASHLGAYHKGGRLTMPDGRAVVTAHMSPASLYGMLVEGYDITERAARVPNVSRVTAVLDRSALKFGSRS